MNSQAQMGAAQQLAHNSGVVPPSSIEKTGSGRDSGGADDDDDMPELEEPEKEQVADEDVDDSNMDPKDIELVMQQVRYSVRLSDRSDEVKLHPRPTAHERRL